MIANGVTVDLFSPNQNQTPSLMMKYDLALAERVIC